MAIVYRIIKYEGTDEWLQRTLDSSIHGTKRVVNGEITVGTIDPADELSITLARDALYNSIARLEKSGEPGFHSD